MLGPVSFCSQDGWPGWEAIVWTGQHAQASKLHQGGPRKPHKVITYQGFWASCSRGPTEEPWGPVPWRRL